MTSLRRVSCLLLPVVLVSGCAARQHGRTAAKPADSPAAAAGGAAEPVPPGSLGAPDQPTV
ncbi:MAG TPA: hypothetical protein VLJ82_04405 [Jatrophihabitans sp.]|nr:hypothetical protein [Jatrophihabitans sp.]